LKDFPFFFWSFEAFLFHKIILSFFFFENLSLCNENRVQISFEEYVEVFVIFQIYDLKIKIKQENALF